MAGPDRYWLLTWTTYGTWLPGDDRGFVGDFVPADLRVRLNQPGTSYAQDISPLRQYAREHLAGPPVYLTAEQATVALAQFQETAGYRGWWLLAAAIMRNHVHLVVGVAGDPEPDTLLRAETSRATPAGRSTGGGRSPFRGRGGRRAAASGS